MAAQGKSLALVKTANLSSGALVLGLGAGGWALPGTINGQHSKDEEVASYGGY